MYRILFVEDEIFVRQGFKNIINWEETGFVYDAEATNGYEALNLLKKEHFDVVITDIKMPKMNGLELIKEVNEKFEVKPKFIIISGYNEFEFAKTALKYNVTNYILKPIDENELIETLSKVKSELDKEYEDRRRKEAYMVVNKSNEFLKYLENMDQRFFGYINQEIVNSIKIMAIIAKIHSQARENDHNILIDILNQFKLYENNHIIAEAFYDHFMNIFMLVKNGSLNFEQTADKIYRIIQNVTNQPISIVYSSMENVFELREVYEKLSKLLNYMYFHGKKGIFYAEQLDGMLKVFKIDDKNLLNQIIKNIEENKMPEIKLNIILFIDKCFEDKVSIEIIKGYLNSLIVELIDYFQVYNINLEDFFSVLGRAFSKDRVIETLYNLCLKVADVYRNQIKNPNHMFSKQLEKYVKDNFTRDITIKEMAKAFYVNPIYLGQLFKKHFGMHFNKYLHLVRVEEAKKLLLKTNKKIYEIAKEVGYKDPDYFAIKFEEIVGTTPTKYRTEKAK